MSVELFYLWLTVTTLVGDVSTTTISQHSAPFLRLQDCEEYADLLVEQLFDENKNVIVQYSCKPSMRVRV